MSSGRLERSGGGRLAGLLGGLVGGLLGGTAGAQVSLVLDGRQVSADVGGSSQVRMPATAFGAWNGTVQAGGPAPAGASATVGQVSSMNGGEFRAQLTSGAQSNYPGAGLPPCITAVVGNDYIVEFDVVTPVRMAVSGTLQRTTVNENLAAVELRLRRESGATILSAAAPDEAGTVGNVNSTAKLGAGRYVFTVTAGSSAGVCSPTNTNADLAADITATLAVLTCPADLNDDGFVDDTDFVLFAQAYDLFACDAQTAYCAGDLEGDGFVDDTDFVFFAQAYDLFACP